MKFQAMNVRTIATLTLGFLTATVFLPAREIGFVEKFSLAEDRSKALEELVAGTQEYYYYSALHALTRQNFKEVDNLLKLWLKRYGSNPRSKEIENRMAMLRYGQDPEGTMKYLRRELNLRFNHSRVVEGRKPTHPTKLSENRISFETMKMIAFSDRNNLQGVEDRGLARLEAEKLNEIRLRDLLSRLRRPDLPGLPALILKDLKNKHSRGFGSHVIHKNLTKEQMDELLQLDPKFIDNSNFVHSYLSKLAPSTDVDPRQDDEEMSKWLNRQLGFTRRLSPAFNSLKANVMHELLVFQRKQGVGRQAFREELQDDIAVLRDLQRADPRPALVVGRAAVRLAVRADALADEEHRHVRRLWALHKFLPRRRCARRTPRRWPHPPSAGHGARARVHIHRLPGCGPARHHPTSLRADAAGEWQHNARQRPRDASLRSARGT